MNVLQELFAFILSSHRRRDMFRCICPVILCLSFIQFSFAEEAYFRSNEIGMELETISEYRLEEYQYYVTVEEEEEVTVKVLFHEGKEIKRWRIEREGRNAILKTES